MTTRRELLVDRRRMYALTADSANMYLEVAFGGIAMENVVVRLTEEEIGAYRQHGKEYLDELAHRIATSRGEYTDRTVNP